MTLWAASHASFPIETQDTGSRQDVIVCNEPYALLCVLLGHTHHSRQSRVVWGYTCGRISHDPWRGKSAELLEGDCFLVGLFAAAGL